MDEQLANELTAKIPKATDLTMSFLRQLVDLSDSPWRSFVSITALYVAREIIDRQLRMNFESNDGLQHDVEHVGRFFMQNAQARGVILVDADGKVMESSSHGDA